MASEIKVNTIKKASGSSIAVGGSGDTITINSGATIIQLAQYQETSKIFNGNRCNKYGSTNNYGICRQRLYH